MQYTTNHQLPQWEASDPIRRNDFNEAMGVIDSMTPYVVGSYTGTGSSLTIELGFRPSFVIITGTRSINADNCDLGKSDIMTGSKTHPVSVSFSVTGFTVTAQTSDLFPDLTHSGRTYEYIAFR